MKKVGILTYFLAMSMSCIGISVSFLSIDLGINCLQIAVMLTLVYFILTVLRYRYTKQNDAFIILLIIFAIMLVIVKMLYYEQIISIAPLMLISNFLILITLICKNTAMNYISYISYIFINIFGSVMLIIGILTNSHSIWGAVQIGYINPQIISSWALIYAMGAILSFDYFFERVRHKLLFLLVEILIYGFMIFISIIADSRFSTLVMLVALFFRIAPVVKIFNNKKVRLVIALFPFLFMIFSQLLVFIGLFSDMDGGTLLNGREIIWQEAIDNVMLNPLFGINYKTIDPNTYYSHNIFVDHCVLFGFPVAFVFVVVLGYIMVCKIPIFKKKKKMRNVSERLKYDAFVMFCLVIFSSTVEGAFFSVGAGGLYLFSYGLLLIAASKEKTRHSRATCER